MFCSLCTRKLGTTNQIGICLVCRQKRCCRDCGVILAAGQRSRCPRCRQLAKYWMGSPYQRTTRGRAGVDPPGWDEHLDKLAARAAVGLPLFP